MSRVKDLPPVKTATELPHWGLNEEERAEVEAKGYVPVDARFVPGVRGVELSLAAVRMGLAKIDRGQLDALELEWKLHKDADPAQKPVDLPQIEGQEDVVAILGAIPATEAFKQKMAEKGKETPNRRKVPEKLQAEGVSPDAVLVASFGPQIGPGRQMGSKDLAPRIRNDHAKQLDTDLTSAIQGEMLNRKD